MITLVFGSSHNTCGEIQLLLPAWITRLDSRSPRGPSVWIAALRLTYSEQYVLVALAHSDLQRVVVHGTTSQLLSGLLRLMLRRITCAKSPGTKRSADAAAGEATPEAGTDQSIAARRLGQESMDQC